MFDRASREGWGSWERAWHRAGRGLVFLPGQRPVWLVYDGRVWGVLPAGLTARQVEDALAVLIVQIVEASIGLPALERRLRYHDARLLMLHADVDARFMAD